MFLKTEVIFLLFMYWLIFKTPLSEGRSLLLAMEENRRPPQGFSTKKHLKARRERDDLPSVWSKPESFTQRFLKQAFNSGWARELDPVSV